MGGNWRGLVVVWALVIGSALSLSVVNTNAEEQELQDDEVEGVEGSQREDRGEQTKEVAGKIFDSPTYIPIVLDCRQRRTCLALEMFMLCHRPCSLSTRIYFRTATLSVT